MGWAENPPPLSWLTPARPPLPPALTLLPAPQSCAETPSSRPRTTVTPAPQSLGTRPPNKSVNTIKGPALLLSLCPSPGSQEQGQGCSPASWQSSGSLQWASSSSSKKSLGKCPRALAWAPPSSAHACLPSSPGNQPMSCLGSQPLPGLGTNPRGLWEADFLDFPPHISMCLGSPSPAVPVNGQVPQMEAPLRESALHVPDSLRVQNWPRGHLSSYLHQLRVHLCKWTKSLECCPWGPWPGPFAPAGEGSLMLEHGSSRSPHRHQLPGAAPICPPAPTPALSLPPEGQSCLREYHFEEPVFITFIYVYCRKFVKSRKLSRK